MEANAIGRREFLVGALGAGAAAAVGLTGCTPSSGASSGTSAQASTSASSSETGSGTTATYDWVGSDPEIAESDITSTETTDVLIIGAGNGGMMAASSAADLGLDFMVCEKGGAVQSPRHWVGVVNSPLHEQAGIAVDENKLLNELVRYASGNCDFSVWKTWIRESSEMFAYLNPIEEAAGMQVFLDVDGNDQKTGGTDYYTPPLQHMWFDPEEAHPFLTAIDKGKPEKARNVLLEKHINELGHEVRYNYKLVKLEREEGGAVTGAVFETSDGYLRVNAENVILCTGGYAADPDMVKFRNPVIDRSVTGASYSPNNTGDGIKAAVRIGADCDSVGATMVFDRGIVPPMTDAGYQGDGAEATLPSPLANPMCMWAASQPFLKVNRAGQRFMNESMPYDFTAHLAGRQPGGVWCTILDSNAPTDVQKSATIGCAQVGAWMFAATGIEGTYGEAVDAGLIAKADTIEELAQRLAIDPDALRATVDRYNELVAAGVDEDFGKESHRLSAIVQPPYYGAWFGGNLLTTIDGLSIDSDAHVLDATGKPIEGLYAVGDCSGNFFSGNYPEYLVGCACGRTLTYARHVVRLIAGDL